MSGVVGPILTTVIDPLFKITIDATQAGSASDKFQGPSEKYYEIS
jgi:hypothetical protein